ncbi:MAG: tRNA (guanosine(37)-N1)-methyltransferase TrmD [Elusimicrobia bacterium]|nr:tRNA (guanosine(37)-N1)-methyltransferase TrmD [Elusimicrobiota bacterium]
MKIEILTLFPEIFEGFLKASLIGKAAQKNLIRIHLHNIRDFGQGRRRQADDRVYGGGAGMVLMAEPIYQALQYIRKNCGLGRAGGASYVLSPRGNRLTPALAQNLAKKKSLILLAGHYEGVDERIVKHFDGELSIGDYVTMGGEIPAMLVIEAAARFIKGVVKEESCVLEDSFSINPGAGSLLEWPQYTRPRLWRGENVPAVLLSGNHAQIQNWRQRQAAQKTKKIRPDLIK